MITKQDIGLIYDTNIDKLYKFFYYRVLSREIAEDLASETFTTFVNLIKEDKEIENPHAFLYGVAKNIFLQYLKQKYKDGIPFTVISEDFEDMVVEEVREVEDKETPEEILLKILPKIPEKQREVIRLRFIEKLSLSEIVEKLGKDMNYVKTTQKRGLKSLKEALETGLKVDEDTP